MTDNPGADPALAKAEPSRLGPSGFDPGEFSAGPWEVGKIGKYRARINAPNSRYSWSDLARVVVRGEEGEDDKEGLANLRLIVAAPELVEALIDIRNRVLCPVGPAPSLDLIAEIASAALARIVTRQGGDAKQAPGEALEPDQASKSVLSAKADNREGRAKRRPSEASGQAYRENL